MARVEETEPEGHDRVESDPRRLYEQNPSKTLWFTTATSRFATATSKAKALRTAYAGIYQCLLEPDSNFDDFNDGDESRESCDSANLLGDWTTFEGAQHHEFILRNLQFDLSSLRSSGRDKKKEKDRSSKNYLYATTHTTFESTFTVIEPNPNYDDDYPVAMKHTSELPDWEILRAELPDRNDYEGTVLNDDGTLRFESVFRTNRTVDSWNECGFDCCVQNVGRRDEPWWGDRDREDVRYAYAQTKTRSFVVDEHTGDVFVSWEGFYKNCSSDANRFAGGRNDGNKLKWTIGISRLRMEDPSCFLPDRDADDDYLDAKLATTRKLHFPRCTEPVAIAFRTSEGRRLVLPYGGLIVIPAILDSTRVFLLSVLKNDEATKTPAEITSEVWSVAEGFDGGEYPEDCLPLERIAQTNISGTFWDAEIWDGGSLRVHYDPSTSLPNHLCRTVYDRGIDCRKLEYGSGRRCQIGNKLGTDCRRPLRTDPCVFSPNYLGEKTVSEPFLTPEQTAVFCEPDRPGEASADDYWREQDAKASLPSSPFAAGLDVRWNAADGSPDRIYFGCGGFGGTGGSRVRDGRGTLGSVSSGGRDLRRVLDGAFAETVVFLPEELEGTTDPFVVVPASAAKRASSSGIDPPGGGRGTAVFLFVLLLLAAAAALVAHLRRRWERNRREEKFPPSWRVLSGLGSPRFRTPYVELQTVDGSATASGLMTEDTRLDVPDVA